MEFYRKLQLICSDFSELTKSLRETTPVHFVSVIRLDKSKRHFSGLCHDFDWVRAYLAEKLYLVDLVFDPSYVVSSPNCHWRLDQIIVESTRVERFVQLCRVNDYASGFNIFSCIGDDLEVYSFVTSKAADPESRFLLAHQDFIKTYQLWLKEQIYSSQRLSDFLNEKPFYLPAELCPLQFKSEVSLQTQTAIKRYFVGGVFMENYLTQKEYECLILLYKHHSVKEVAEKMHVSVATVQTYILKIRSKAGNIKMADVLRKI